MENKENTINKTNKAAETLAKELEGLSNEGLHEFFMFFYKMNHMNGYMITNEKFEEFLKVCDNEKDDLFWAMFKGYMVSFYKSDYCTHYERIRHQLNLRLSDFEYEKFLSVPADRNIEKFIFLLRNFDADGDLDYVREGKTSRKITFKYGESVYDLLMRVPAEKKSQKFLLCLYQFILK